MAPPSPAVGSVLHSPVVLHHALNQLFFLSFSYILFWFLNYESIYRRKEYYNKCETSIWHGNTTRNLIISGQCMAANSVKVAANNTLLAVT